MVFDFYSKAELTLYIFLKVSGGGGLIKDKTPFLWVEHSDRHFKIIPYKRFGEVAFQMKQIFRLKYIFY